MCLKEVLNVVARAFLHGAEGHVAARGAQVLEIRLRVGLVLPLQSFGEGDVLDFALRDGFLQRELFAAVGFPEAVHHGERDVVEGLRTARAAVVDPRDRVVEEVHQDVRHVVDVDEVAKLRAVGVAQAPFEELDAPFAAVLEVLVVGDARHAALVLLVRPVDVAVAQTHDRGAQEGHLTAQNLVEEVLRVAVDVQGPFAAEVFDELRLRAVGGGRGRIDEGDPELLRPMEEIERVAVVVLHHVDAVLLHGVGAGALMEDRRGLRGGPGAHAGDEVALVEVVRNAALREVDELLALFEAVDGDLVGDAARVEGEDVVAADEAGGAGDENAHVSASMWCALRGARKSNQLPKSSS